MGTQDRGFDPFRSLTEIETKRVNLQAILDSKKAIEDRRMLGQFATPYALADEIVSYAMSVFGSADISYLEPALGTGAFFSALLQNLKSTGQLKTALGYEIDLHVGEVARFLWSDSMSVRIEDFCFSDIKQQSINLLITNPPYVRHHLLSKEYKERLSFKISSLTGRKLSGLAGLYCYFILISHKWLAPDAISAWLIPSEFMDVNYGSAIKSYLLHDVQLMRIHRYDPHDSIFNDATVSSCVVWFKNRQIYNDYDIEFSYGGTHSNPSISKLISKSKLLVEKKWTRFPEKDSRDYDSRTPRLKDFFVIKRGIATGDNGFFIVSDEKVNKIGLKKDYLRPILPSPRNLLMDEIESDSDGQPRLDNRSFLVDCQLNEADIEKRYPELWGYLRSGIGTTSERYLCRSRKRWYFQERRKATPFLCTYMGRNVMGSQRPFHFILNHSKAIATNSFLMLYPTKNLQDRIDLDPNVIRLTWKYLNSLSIDALESESRIYGGGLRKIEPNELGEIECPALVKMIFDDEWNVQRTEQMRMQL